MKGTRFLSIVLLVLMLVTMIPFGAIVASAETIVAPEDAMEDIKGELGESSTEKSYQIGETITANDGGYVGDVEITVFFDKENHTAKSGYDGSHLVMYVVNTITERIGTKSDTEIIGSMLERGYIVAVVDYKNNPAACGTALYTSLNFIRSKLIVKGNYLTDSCFPSGTYRKHFIVPAGYDISTELVFWEADKHATDGTLEEILDIWNTDMRGTKPQSYVKWTYVDEQGNTVRKKVTDNAVWYSDNKGTVDNANGEYTMLKYTVAESVHDLVNPDGSPLQLELYANVIYPTEPKEDVPVMAAHNYAGNIWDVDIRIDRPHFNGFLFTGYAGVCYDYLLIPMTRDDSFGYFDGNDNGAGSGDPISYSIDLYNDKLVNTAAMRFIRYLSLSDHDTYAFDNSKIGVQGLSKSGTHHFLGEAVVQSALVPETEGMSETELLEAINDKLCSFTQMRYPAGYDGATRYQKGMTEDVTEKGITIKGGELQPWLTYNGEEIISGAQLIYCSAPNNEEDISAGHAPTFISAQLGDDVYSGSYGTYSAYVNLCRQLDVPSAFFVVNEGHSYALGPDVDYGVTTIDAYYDFVGYYLKDDAVKVLYVNPVNNNLAASVTSEITVKFTGPVSAEEIAAVTVKSSDGTALTGSWSSLFGNTEWVFTPNASMTPSDKYTVTVPATVKGDNGKEMGKAYTSVFTTEAAVEYEGETAVTANGTRVTVTVPELGEDYLNALSIRAFVSTENAANRLDVYNEATSELVGSIYLKGAGYYSLDVSEYLSAYNAGDKVTFLVKQGKTAVTDTDYYTENFDGGIGDCSKGSYAQFEAVTFEGESAVKLMITDDTVAYPNNPFYLTLSEIIKNDKLIKNGKIDETDYGRRFTVSVRVYDTVSRRITLQMASCDAARTYKTFDTDRAMTNLETVAGEWVTLTLNYTVYDSDYGLGGDHVQSLSILLAPDGSKESPIYIDEITVTETVTDVEFSDVALVAYSKGDYSYKTPAGEKPLAIYDASGMVKGSYDTLAAAMSAYASGDTLKLERDYYFTSAHAFMGFASISAVNIDLNGYSVYCEGTTPFILLKTTSAAVAKTVINVSGGNVLLTGAPLIGYDGSTSAGAGKSYAINANGVKIVTGEGFTPYGVVSAHTITSGCTVDSDITLTGCSFELKNEGLFTWDIALFKASTGSLSTSYTVAGGSIKLDSFRKIKVCDASADIKFITSGGKYTSVTVPSYVTVPSESYSTDTGYRGFTTESTGDDWFNYTLVQDELSTSYGVIPEEYADKELYPFVIFNKNGEFIAATADWGTDGKTSALHTGKGAGDGAVILLRRDYTLTNATGFNNLSQVNGTMTIDLNGYTFTITVSVPMLNAEAKDNQDSTVIVKNGTVRTKVASIVRYSSVAFDSYKGQKNFAIVFDGVTLGFAEGATGISNLISVTWSPATAKGTNSSLTLKNCDIDLVTNALTGNYNIFNVNDGSSHVKVSVALEGGSIKADSFKNVTLASINASTGSSIRLNKSAEGAYTALLVKDTANILGDAIYTEDGYRAYKATANVNDDGYTECELSDDLIVTKYGVVPDTYKDKAFVAFSNGVCIGAADKFFHGGSGILGIAQNYMRTKNESLAKADGSFPSNAVSVQIVVLKDHTTSGENAFDNLATVAGELTVDLNGKTLTVATWQGIRLQSKLNAYNTSLIFKNGNMVVAQNDFIALKSWTAQNCVEGKRFALSFEDINFSLAKMSNGSTPANLIGFQKQGDVTVYFDISFKDCTFDLTGATQKIPLFKANDPTDISGVNCTKSFIINYTVEGCDIKATALSKFAIKGSFNALSTFTYEKSEATGLYTTITLPKSATAPTDTVTIDGKSYSYAANSEANDYTTYALGEVTKYGVIPAKYADVDEYPFVLFHNGKCVFAHNKFMQNNSDPNKDVLTYAKTLSEKDANQNIVILFRKDYTHNGVRYDNLALLKSPVILDLNGFTLSNNSTNALFRMQMKGNYTGEILIKVIDGTVLLSKSPLVHYSIWGSSFKGNMCMTLTLENVDLKFVEGATTKKLTDFNLDTAAIKDYEIPISYANLNFVNSTIDLTNAPKGFNFVYAKDSYYNAEYPNVRITTTVEGGSIIKGANDLVWFVTNANDVSGSALILKKLDGSYPTLIVTSGNAPTEAFNTPEGEMYFTPSGTDGVYVLTAHTHSYEAVVTAPTCTEGGYTTYTCACGDSYVGDYTEANGHTEVTVPGYPATCTENGLTDGAKCSVCATIIIEQLEILATGHNYKTVVTAPTCTEQGYTTYTCVCGDSYKDDYIEAIGHVYDDDYDADCNVCGEVREVEIPVYTVAEGVCGVNTTWVLTSDGVLTISGNGDTEDYLVSITTEQPYRAYADKITKVVIEDGVTSIGRGAFYGFTAIEEVILPESLIAIHEYAFFGCSALKSIVIPENTTYIGMYAFRKAGIIELTMPMLEAWEFADGTKLDIETMIKAFTTSATYKQTCIRPIYEDGDIIAEGVFGNKDQFSWTLTSTGVLTVSGNGAMPKFNVNTTPWYGYRGAIRSVVIEEGITSVGRCSFHTCRAITSVTLPESLETIAEYAFYNCQFLTEATIPANVTRIEIFAFRKCFELKSVEFVYYYGWYVGEEKLSVSELTANPADSLTLVYYSKIWTRDVNAEPEFADPNVFAGGACNAFTKWSLTYVDGTKTKMKLTVSGNGALPKFETAGAPWYGYLNDIVEIEVCEGVTEIGRCSFYGLKFVKTVTVANTVTSINDYAFSGCYSLKSIEIPASVTFIAETAFTKTGLSEIPTV